MTAAPATHDFTADPKVASGPVLVATRGDASSDGALTVAGQLARSLGTGVHVLGVIEPMPVIAPEYGVLVPQPDADDERERLLRQAIDDQLARVGAASDDWRLEVCRGDTVTRVTHTASVEDARVIVTGLGRHQLLDRLFGSETALHILRHADVPVLAVPPGVTSLPTRAVVAVDFSEGSSRALRLALDLLKEVTEVHLAHVAPRVDSPADLVARWEGSYATGLAAAYSQLNESAAIPSSVRVAEAPLRGEPARELLRYASEVSADVVVSGSRGHGVIERMLIGSVATGIMRGASTMVFMVPTPQGTHHRDAGDFRVESSADASHWPELLAAFTNRNAACRSILTWEDRAHPARAQEMDYPLLGVTYDPRDQRVEIMVGDASPEGRHLTHSIGAVRSIEVMRDDDGFDRELRAVHGDGVSRLVILR